jgi:hypothetical protein
VYALEVPSVTLIFGGDGSKEGIKFKNPSFFKII